MKCEVKLYVAGTVFTETVQARNYQEARQVALARNPNAKVIGVTAVFTYLDPPYDIKDNLYGKKGGMHKKFDHDMFATECDNWTSPMLISYNSDQIVKDRFKEWTVGEFAHTYTMRSVGCYNTDQAERKELVLTNYEV